MFPLPLPTPIPFPHPLPFSSSFLIFSIVNPLLFCLPANLLFISIPCVESDSTYRHNVREGESISEHGILL
ncbi:MAG TPA: hypothetical protein DCY86_06940 [Bdellovibrionales bacterium]|nr:hypothetical protein [Bdellovibrionales bacterium]